MYNLIVYLYGFVAKIFAFFNPKAKLWIEGRTGFFDKFSENVTLLKSENEPIIWFHCASLGEFEQGRPLIERIKNDYPNYKIVLTFFSPSGYEVRKQYAYADLIIYLPLDTPNNAKKFIEILQPNIVFWVKYEFWKNYLKALSNRNIPVFLISAIFRENHFFFSPFGKFHRKTLNYFTHTFLQNENSAIHLKSIDYTNTSVVGDTRLDRVLAIANTPKRLALIEAFAQQSDKPIFICGSTWQPDEAIISRYINENKAHLPFKFIIAPHEIKKEKINDLESNISIPTIRYSNATLENITNFEVLIIDNIGMLSTLYRYGKLAYVGGALGSGLHNTLEPIVFSLPVIFGEKYQKFEEAIYLVDKKGGFSIKNYEEFCAVVKQLEDEVFYKKSAIIAKKYVLDNRGATDKIMNSKQVKRILE